MAVAQDYAAIGAAWPHQDRAYKDEGSAGLPIVSRAAVEQPVPLWSPGCQWLIRPSQSRVHDERARAIRTRCCSPPESDWVVLDALAQADLLQQSPAPCKAVACEINSNGSRTFSRASRRDQLVGLKDKADLQPRTSASWVSASCGWARRQARFRRNSVCRVRR